MLLKLAVSILRITRLYSFITFVWNNQVLYQTFDCTILGLTWTLYLLEAVCRSREINMLNPSGVFPGDWYVTDTISF